VTGTGAPVTVCQDQRHRWKSRSLMPAKIFWLEKATAHLKRGSPAADGRVFIANGELFVCNSDIRIRISLPSFADVTQVLQAR
jgi:hypothetical protein